MSPTPRFERTAPWEEAYSAARPFMLRAADEGMSFNAFYDVARDSGISYRRARMLEDWRTVLGVYRNETLIRNMSADRVIPENYTMAGPAGQTAPYRAVIQYTYTDPTTGEELTGTRVIGSDRLRTRSELESIASHAFEPGRPYADPTAGDFRLRAIYRQV
jgi:hypothetical protein